MQIKCQNVIYDAHNTFVKTSYKYLNTFVSNNCTYSLTGKVSNSAIKRITCDENCDNLVISSAVLTNINMYKCFLNQFEQFHWPCTFYSQVLN